jgi:hypothetical protein
MLPLMKIINAEIIEKEGTRFESMFIHGKLEELALIFNIFRHFEISLNFISKKMRPYIEARGEKIIADKTLQKDPIEFTIKLLSFKAEIDLMVEKNFQNDINF